MKRRLTIATLAIAALIFGVLTYSSINPIGANALTADAVSTPLLSPQRIPIVLSSLSNDSSIRATVNNAKIGGQDCIVVSRDNRTVAAINPNKPLIPASTLKLLTANAALNLFGSDGKFTTSIKAANNSNGVVNGPLYLVGGGDPLLFTSQYSQALKRNDDIHTSLEALADQVKAKGITNVHGSVVGDDSRFDQVRYLSSWDPGYQAQGQIGPTGALQVNQGFEKFTGGRVPAVSPTLQAAAVFTDLLKQRGIKVDGQPASGLTPNKAENITDIQSVPVSSVVAEMLTESDNTTAEMMLRNIGVVASGQGTFAAGIAAVKTEAAKAGIPLDGVVMVDGSGLDRSDRATCATLTAALTHTGPKGVIASGLPKAGQTGTLADRMTNTPAVNRVAAKTGTLAGVSALAGWVTPDKGSPMAFTIVNNGVTSELARTFEDNLAQSLASLPATADSGAYAPSNQ